MKLFPRTPIWLWLNLLSLDAPLVAVVWQDLLARCYPSMLRPAGRWTLGLTVWVIYLADRLIDVRHPAPQVETFRHGFYRHHRWAAITLLAMAATADLLVALFWLRPAVLSTGLWVGCAVAGYLGLFALLRIGRDWSKQLCAAILFTAGTFLVAWTSTQQAVNILALPAAAFCGLCLSNLMLLEKWERRDLTNFAPGWLLPLAWTGAWWGDSRWYIAIALSLTGLAVLDFASARISKEARHVLADAVLLTPLFL